MQADLLFMSEGTYLKVSKEVKHEILERLAESMYSYTAYPTAAQFQSVSSTEKQAPLSPRARLNHSQLWLEKYWISS